MSEQPDIVVTAFSARYSAAYAKLAPIEGGFSNDPLDRGGPTNHGVSLRFLFAEGMIDVDEDGVNDFDLDLDGDLDVADIRSLSSSDAKYLFARCFWNRLGCEDIIAPIGEAMFDQAVNGGLTASRRLLQRAINACLRQRAGSAWRPIRDDGVIGPVTRAALDHVVSTRGVQPLLAEYRRVTADRYREIVAGRPSQERFLKGWLARAKMLGAA